jgi:glycerol uptake facilitator-like aquaporin
MGRASDVGLPVLEVGTHPRGEPNLRLSEGIATFGLFAGDLRHPAREPEALPLCVGLYILAAYWFTASTSFANPAVTLA